MIESERGEQPLFIFVYTVFNHFPWWNKLAAGTDAGLAGPRQRSGGRRIHPPADAERAATTRNSSSGCARDFPRDSFLMLRFGDHQPGLSTTIIEPTASEAVMAQRMMTHDPRYFTTYYAIERINYRPKDLSSALDRLEAPYMPLVVQEAAGLPLDPTFAEQKKIMDRCNGMFFTCADGAEARRFNRLLIDAGLIKGMVSR